MQMTPSCQLSVFTWSHTPTTTTSAAVLVSVTDVCLCVNLSCCWLKLVCWGSTFTERRREEKRLGCGCSGNDRFAFKLVFTDSAQSIHTQTDTWCMKTCSHANAVRAAQSGSTAVNFVCRVREANQFLWDTQLTHSEVKLGMVLKFYWAMLKML